MATIIKSRFAGLKIEDDDFSPVAEGPKRIKSASASGKKPEPAKKAKNGKLTAQNGNGGGKKKVKKPVVTEQQWEQWKQKDEEMVDGAFEEELTQAILLSKLDYEERKDVYAAMRRQTESEKRAAAAEAARGKQPAGKKQKKKNVMSLEQFNDMVAGDDKRVEEHSDSPDPAEEPAPVTDTEFFERVQDEAQKELRKDKHKDTVLQRQPPSNEVINRVQFSEALERKDKEIADLSDEVTRLKEELLTVKSRNKKLCNILGQGEMRDKAEALVEVERLRQVQSELTTEVASLHALLEQERSRQADPRANNKKKKSASSEKEK